MKYRKHWIAWGVGLSLLVSSGISAFADTGPVEFQNEANTLYELGFYKGISATEFVPDLEKKVNREFGIVMFMRVLGYQAEADRMTKEEIVSVLEKFEDAKDLNEWAKPYVATAVKNKLISGVSLTKLGLSSPLTGKMYSLMILRKLGYEVTSALLNDPAKLLQMANEINLKPSEAVRFFKDEQLNKDKAVGMLFKTLTLKAKKGTTLMEDLVEKNGELAKKAQALGLYMPKAKVFAPEFLQEARALYALGIFKGTLQKKFEASLAKSATNADSIITLLKAFGLEQEVNKLTVEEAENILSRFEDGNTTDAKSKKFMAYVVLNKIYHPLEANKLNPNAVIFSKEYMKMVGFVLGLKPDVFDFNDSQVVREMIEKSGVDPKELLRFFRDQPLNRDELMGITHKALGLREIAKTILQEIPK